MRIMTQVRYKALLISCNIQPLHRHSQPFAPVLRMSRTHPKMKLFNRPSISFIDYISYRQLIDHRLIVDIPNTYTYWCIVRRKESA